MVGVAAPAIFCAQASALANDRSTGFSQRTGFPAATRLLDKIGIRRRGGGDEDCIDFGGERKKFLHAKSFGHLIGRGFVDVEDAGESSLWMARDVGCVHAADAASEDGDMIPSP